jgi:cytochrome c2
LGGVWDEEMLYAFIIHPMAVAPGTKMDRDELGKPQEPQERADIIAYLRSLGAGQPRSD